MFLGIHCRISFPGGKVDKVGFTLEGVLVSLLMAKIKFGLQFDASPMAGALRETTEEIGIANEHIEILGPFGPAEKSLHGMRVWPFVVSAHQSLQSATNYIDNEILGIHSLSSMSTHDKDG